MTEYGAQSQTLIYSAFYETDDDKNENLGLPLVFSIDKDITLDSTFDSLKPSIQYHFNTDLAHNNDEDGDLPIIKPTWLSNKLCILNVNHLAQPHVLRLKDGKFNTLEYTNVRMFPNILRPKNAQGNDLMDATECLGTTLGSFMIESALVPEMSQKVEVSLFGEDEQRPYPAILGIYGLDGNLYTYYVYHEDQELFKPVKKAQKANELPPWVEAKENV